VLVNEVRFRGNTALSNGELQAIAQPYTGRELSWSDLDALRDAITLAYVNQGYVTSGAVIEEQSLADHVLEVQIVEGVLAEIRIENEGRFRGVLT
jgi:hemolysin activation/secretion protein